MRLTRPTTVLLCWLTLSMPANGLLGSPEPAGTTRAARATAGAEVRAIWVTRWDFRTAADVRRIVANCASLGLNRIYFQVRGRSDAFYRSSLEPWGEELKTSSPNFDPLQTAISTAREYGIELHAWVNVLAGWKGLKPPKDRRHVWHQHPEWFLLDQNGKRYRLSDHYTMLNPCLPKVRHHIASVLGDIASRYEIDGMHLDYIRFVFPDVSRRHAVPYDRDSLDLFRRLYGALPEQKPADWDAFRKRAVNSVVYEASRAVRRARPNAQISCAVIRDIGNARRKYLQDSPTWLSQGWVDEILTMNYERTEREFARKTRLDTNLTSRTSLVPGLGVYLFRTAGQLRDQIVSSRRLGSPGYCLFAYSNFFSSTSHESKAGNSAERLRRQMRETLRSLNRT